MNKLYRNSLCTIILAIAFSGITNKSFSQELASFSSGNDFLSIKLPEPPALYAYPNPFHAQTNIYLLNPCLEVAAYLYSSNGVLLSKESFSNTRQLKINLDFLPAGIYIAKIYGDNKEIGILKLVTGK